MVVRFVPSLSWPRPRPALVAPERWRRALKGLRPATACRFWIADTDRSHAQRVAIGRSNQDLAIKVLPSGVLRP